jgi:signal transduction histidine kinase/DNA-binding NarL/FixJ family response regulator
LPLRDSITNYFTGSSPSLTLKYNENYVSFRFCALNFSKPEENSYQYQLSGLQDYWVKRKADQNVATYTNLDPGTYTFRVKASNHDGVWNEQGASFQITIMPPPWKSWWALSAYVIFLAWLSYWVWQRLVTRARLQTLATIKSAEAEKLREVDVMKSHFFANISHEFRTPLTLLLGPIEKRLMESQTSGDKAELGIMHRNASRLLTLVNQLLDLSKLEARTMKLRCEKVDLQAALLSITSQFSSIADSKQIGFEVYFNQAPSLYLDRDKFEKIATNLLSNAFKFTPAEGHITITVDAYPPGDRFLEGHAEIIFADTGPGIIPEHLTKVFDRFFQADMSSTRAYEGTGIGLSLARELVELHHGSISVISSVGLGSVFTVSIPLGKEHLSLEEISGEAEIPDTKIANGVRYELPKSVVALDRSRTLPRVLIVEDNSDLRFYLKENLSHDFILLEAEDGQAGISSALAEVPDLIISDLMMPKANGLQLCEQLKADEKTSHIPIILLTAKADSDTRLRGYKTGADDYISKPFQIEELRIRLTNLLLNRKRIQDRNAKNLSLNPASVPVASVDERFLKRAMEVVEKFLGDPSFGVEVFAQEMSVSHTQLYRKIQGITGLGPNEFIRHFRLSRAADLMRQKAGNVAEITYRVGFNNLSYFSKIFKEKFSVTPSEFLKNPQTKG